MNIGNGISAPMQQHIRRSTLKSEPCTAAWRKNMKWMHWQGATGRVMYKTKYKRKGWGQPEPRRRQIRHSMPLNASVVHRPCCVLRRQNPEWGDVCRTS